MHIYYILDYLKWHLYVLFSYVYKIPKIYKLNIENN